jgi:cytochrome b561
MSRPPDQFSTAQKVLHWTIAVIVFIMVPVGLTMANVLGDGPFKNVLYELHKSFGIIIFCLAAVRVCIRLARGAPPLVPGLPAWQRAAAHASHYALYLLIVLVPIAGWAGTSACCAPVNVFWTVPVTLPLPDSMDLAKQIFRVHDTLALTLAAIVLVHASAALHHHFVRRDATLLRMLPRGTSGERIRREVRVPDRARGA